MKEFKHQPLTSSVPRRRSPKVRRRRPRRKDFCSWSARRSPEIRVRMPVFIRIFFEAISQRRRLDAAALAEGVGFEPTIRFPVYTLSKRAPSATRPSLRKLLAVPAFLLYDAREARFCALFCALTTGL